MSKGGYQIIDFKNVNHTLGVGVVHEGLYDLIEGTRKPIMISGVVFEGKEYGDRFVSIETFEGDYTIQYSAHPNQDGFNIIINVNDVVTFNEM